MLFSWIRVAETVGPSPKATGPFLGVTFARVLVARAEREASVVDVADVDEMTVE